jgi:hypothetical protein
VLSIRAAVGLLALPEVLEVVLGRADAEVDRLASQCTVRCSIAAAIGCMSCDDDGRPRQSSEGTTLKRRTDRGRG